MRSSLIAVGYSITLEGERSGSHMAEEDRTNKLRSGSTSGYGRYVKIPVGPQAAGICLTQTPNLDPSLV